MLLFAGIMSSVLADRVGRRQLLMYSFAGTALCYIFSGAYFFCQEVLKIDQDLLTPYGYVPFAGILGSSIISTLGFTTIIFVIVAEIFPMNIKVVAMSCMSIFGGILGFVAGKGYQELKNLVGLCGVFWVFAGIAIAGAIFTVMYVPETRGKSLAEIQVLLQGEHYNDPNEKPKDVFNEIPLDDQFKDIELEELNKKEKV
jgi:MFS family permease